MNILMRNFLMLFSIVISASSINASAAPAAGTPLSTPWTDKATWSAEEKKLADIGKHYAAFIAQAGKSSYDLTSAPCALLLKSLFAEPLEKVLNGKEDMLKGNHTRAGLIMQLTGVKTDIIAKMHALSDEALRDAKTTRPWELRPQKKENCIPDTATNKIIVRFEIITAFSA